jgi:DNA-binding response OmpR family regulator
METPRTPEETGARVPRVAIVDDDPTFLAAVTRMFEREGWDVSGFATSLGVVSFLLALHPDLILLDLRLERPNSSWLLLRLLREELTSTREIPIMVWSVDVEQMRKRRPWLNFHGIPALTKPLDLDKVMSIASGLTGGQKLPSGGR